ncbi:MAG: alpha/beta hydrolase [Clostridiales bacterium]|nr:alpha/beta hydrolase [Clostridiales bacterium]
MNKKFTKIISVILSVVMLISVCVISVSAAESGDYYYTQGDYTIHYTVYAAEGESKGNILFMHGFLYSGSTWNGVAEIMSSEGYDCYLVDLPNYGESTRENGDTEIIEREELMVGLMESVASLDQWIVAGHSMGGGIALNIACDHPEIQALLLYCPSEINMVQSNFLTSITTNTLLMNGFQKIFNAILSMKFIVKLAVYLVTKDWSYAKNYDTDVLTEPLKQGGTFMGMMYSSMIARNTDLEAASSLDMPIMLMWAEDDNVLSSSNVSNIANALTNAEVNTVAGGHIVIETDPETVAGITVDFLSQLA